MMKFHYANATKKARVPKRSPKVGEVRERPALVKRLADFVCVGNLRFESVSSSIQTSCTREND